MFGLDQATAALLIGHSSCLVNPSFRHTVLIIQEPRLSNVNTCYLGWFRIVTDLIQVWRQSSSALCRWQTNASLISWMWIYWPTSSRSSGIWRHKRVALLSLPNMVPTPTTRTSCRYTIGVAPSQGWRTQRHCANAINDAKPRGTREGADCMSRDFKRPKPWLPCGLVALPYVPSA